MGNQNAFPKHIDKTVIRFFLAVFFISASVFAYRYSKYEPCKEIAFEIKAKEFRQEGLIKFIDQTENANSWEWDFGDSTVVGTGREALHNYKKPGEYNVRLLVNGICEKNELITIKEKRFVLDSTKLAKFTLPSTITVGEVLKVKDSTNNASTWEWRFGETNEANSKEKNAEYTYTEPGLKTVSLVVNGDVKHSTAKQIDVLPLDEPEDIINPITKPKRPLGYDIKAKPKALGSGIKDRPSSGNKPSSAPYINDDQFKNKLLLVSARKLKSGNFSKYFCGDLNKQILVNGKETTFLKFCETIKGKRLKVKDLELHRVPGSNCINTVSIKHNKFSLFGGN